MYLEEVHDFQAQLNIRLRYKAVKWILTQEKLTIENIVK